MKKLKLLTAVCLIIAMLVSACPMALAASVSELGVNWIFNPVKGVKGYIYSANSYGFVISNYENYNQAYVTENGILLDGDKTRFCHVSDDKLVIYYTDEGKGLMDLKGKVYVKPGTYADLYTIGGKLFEYGTNDNSFRGIKDLNTKTIIPAKYLFFTSADTIVGYVDGVYDVYNRNGKFLDSYSEDDIREVKPLEKDGKYMVVFDNPDKQCVTTRIMTSKGNIVAEIDRGLTTYSDDKLVGYEWIEDRGFRTYYYDYKGKLLEVREDEDFYGYSYEEWKNIKYYIDDYEPRNVLNKNDDIVYRAPKNFYVDAIFNETFVKIVSDDTGYCGLVDFSGKEIVPVIYDNIKYSKGLDMYAFEKDEKISIGKIRPVKVSVNGKNVSFDQNPVVKDGRTLVPLRAILEALGAKLTWDGATQTIRASLGSTNIKLVVGSKEMKVNDKKIKIDVPAEIINGRTLVPARAIGEAFNCSVKWDETNRTVIIKK